MIFGAFLARSRPILRWLHVASLIWGILTELLLWPCPLTWLEDWLESRAGIEPYQGGFLLHYLDKVIYPVSRYFGDYTPVLGEPRPPIAPAQKASTIKVGPSANGRMRNGNILHASLKDKRDVGLFGLDALQQGDAFRSPHHQIGNYEFELFTGIE